MKRILYIITLTAAFFITGCGSSFFSARDYLTGPVDGVGLKKTTAIVEGSTEHLYPVVTPSKTSNKNVSWTSSVPAVATVDANGIVTALKVGSAVITVTTAEGGFSSSCAVDVSIKPIAVTGVTLSKNASILLTGKTEQLSTVISPSNATNQTLVWVSDNAVAAAVGTDGLVTARKAGTAKISVLTADGGYKASCQYTVSDDPVAVTDVTLNKSATTIAVGTANAEKLYASIVPSNATDPNCTWSSDDKSIAIVDTLGFVTGINPGSAAITVKTADGGFIDTCSCTIVAKATSVNSVTLSPNSVILTAGLAKQLTATVSPSAATNQNLTWSSSNTAVAKVDSSGLVTGAAEGSAVITVTSVDGGKTASCSCAVSALVFPVDSVALNKKETALSIGSAETLYASVSPSFASDKGVKWTSSDPLIVSVDSSGTVAGKKAGTAKITVTAANGKTAYCDCTVASAAVLVDSISIPAALTVSTASPVPLSAVISPPNATNQNVTWETSDSSVATVSSGGVVTGVGAGIPTATITATTADGGHKAACVVTVNAQAESIYLNYSSYEFTAVGNITLSAAFIPANTANQTVTWTSLDSSIASISGSTGTVATIVPVSCGTTVITVTSADGNKTADCVITVTGYNLKFNANGGIGNLPASAQYASGTVVTLPGNTGGLARTDFVFAGWGATASGDAGIVTSCLMGGGSKTLYALWKYDVAHSYDIGTAGPGGGRIFYDKGYLSNGWQYMEVGPSDIGGSMEWCNGYLSGGYDPGTGPVTTAEVGAGLSNTSNVIAEYAAEGYIANAAKTCVDYSNNGYDDWFLPSSGEIQLIYNKLGSDGFEKGMYANSPIFYWTSTQKQNSYWYQYSGAFGFEDNWNDYAANHDTGYRSLVRPVRRF